MSITGYRRKATQPNIPTLDEDPAERKRILNVLAQRRSRRNKKEQLRDLEHAAGKGCSLNTTSVRHAQTLAPFDVVPSVEDSTFNHCSNMLNNPTMSSEPFLLQPEVITQGFVDPTCLNPATLEAFDASFSFALPSLPSTPSISNASTTPSNRFDRDLQSTPIFDDNLGTDEVHLPMLELNLIRGAMAVAGRVGVDSIIWSLDAMSPFYNSTALTYSHLPSNLRPTTIQIRNAHHPVFDILPWPSVRDKLILVFSQPHDVRPPKARAPTALLDLVYDMEDSAEGIRIWGDDPCADENWEIGEKLFSNWWWALNSQVINRSNEMRSNRGATILGVDRSVQEIE